MSDEDRKYRGFLLGPAVQASAVWLVTIYRDAGGRVPIHPGMSTVTAATPEEAYRKAEAAVDELLKGQPPP